MSNPAAPRRSKRRPSSAAATDDIAERVRKIGGLTLRSIGQIGRLQRVLDNDADYVTPLDMLAEQRDDNQRLAAYMRETHALCDTYGDVARPNGAMCVAP